MSLDEKTVDELVEAMHKRFAEPPKYHCPRCQFPVYWMNALCGKCQAEPRKAQP